MLTQLLSSFLLLNLNLTNLTTLNLTKNRYNPSCIQYIEWVGSDLSSNMTKILQRARKEIQYSGTYYNSQGDYYQCISAEDRSYYILYLDPGIPTIGQLFYSLCLNNSCTGDDVKELVNNLDIVLKVTDVIEPKMIENQSKATWTTYLVLVVVFACILLTIVMSILNSIPSLHPKVKDNKKLKYLNMFAYQNTKEVFNRPGDIKFLNGIKGVCFVLVVIGHQIIQLLKVSTILNIYSIYLVQSKVLTTTILSYLFSIDVFLYISGFMLGYLFPRRYLREAGILIFFKTLFNRALRFWPMFILATFLYWSVLPSVGSGPFFWKASSLTAHCATSWWKDLLFFGNFTQMCMSWAWYVQVDIQLFALCLFLLFIYTRMNRTLSTAVQHILIIGSIIYLIVICNKNHFKVWATMDYLKSRECQEYIAKVYYMPLTRVSVYVFGLSIGVFYFEYFQYKQKLKQKQGVLRKYFVVKKVIKVFESRINRILSMVIGMGFILFLLFIPSTIPDNDWSQSLHGVYLGMARLFIVVGVFLLTLPSMLGYTNPLHSVLESRVLQFIAKISFSAYLFHDIYIIWRNITIPYTAYLTPQFILYKSVVDLVPILAGGFVLSVTIEFPIAAILDELMGKGKGKAKLKAQEDF